LSLRERAGCGDDGEQGSNDGVPHDPHPNSSLVDGTLRLNGR
jgi:hypothetical protein